MNSRQIAVLGAGGFLGSHLVQALLARTAHRVHALDLNIQRLDELALANAGRLKLTRDTVTSPQIVAQIGEESEIVISLTALCNPSLYNTQPIDVIAANYADLVPLVECCAERQRWLIHFSTCEVYGKPPGGTDGQEPLVEDSSPLVLGPLHRERWTYACAKQLLERLIWAHGQHGGLPFTIVRPFNVIGPRMDYLPGVDGEGVPRVLACFIHALLHGEPLALVDGGQQRRSFVYVDDFVDAVLRIIDRPRRCRAEVLNLGNPDNELRIAELAEAMIDAFSALDGGTRGTTREVSAEQFYGQGYDDADYRIPDIGKARRLLGWQPQTTLAEMLPIVLEDYVRRYGSLIQRTPAAQQMRTAR